MIRIELAKQWRRPRTLLTFAALALFTIVLTFTRVPTSPQGVPGSAPQPAEAVRALPADIRARGGVIALAVSIGAYGISVAMVSTTTSLFLANAVHAAPLAIGLFFAGRGVTAIVVNMVAGRLSDRLRDRRGLLGISAVAAAAGALCFAALRGYVTVFLAGAVLFSLGGVTFSQLFAYAKELADGRGQSMTAFGSTMRSMFSAAWVIGPPFGFFLLNRYGFGPTYLAAGGLCLLTAIAGRFGLPRVPVPQVPVPQVPVPQVTSAPRARASQDVRAVLLGRRTLLLLAGVVVLGVVDQMYAIDVPLYVTKDLHLGAALVGWMAGAGAALEIPIMIAAGRVAERVGMLRLVIAAAVGAAVFFCLLPLASSAPALLALQVLRAAWTALEVSIPMLMIQKELPGGAGMSSSLYSTAYTTAGLIAGAVTGVTSAALGFRNVFWVCAGLSVLATGLLAARRTRGGAPPGGLPREVPVTA